MFRSLSAVLVAVACLCFLGGKLHAQVRSCPCSAASGCNCTKPSGANGSFFLCPTQSGQPCPVSHETPTNTNTNGHYAYQRVCNGTSCRYELVWVPDPAPAKTDAKPTATLPAIPVTAPSACTSCQSSPSSRQTTTGHTGPVRKLVQAVRNRRLPQPLP